MDKMCFILLNGTPPTKELLNSMDLKDSLFICADGAFNGLSCQHREMVDILLGDFDSLDINGVNIPKHIKIKSFPTEKDFTDGYLAIEEAKKQGATHITILGASGGRIDHEYNNYTLLSTAKAQNIQASITNEEFDVYLIDGKLHAKTFVGAIISLVPFGKSSHILYTNGLKYKADGLVLSKDGAECVGSVMGISNSAIENDVEIELCGSTLVFIQREARFK